MAIIAFASSCAGNRANQADLDATVDVTETALVHCFASRAVTLDDHLSDASTLAQGVVEACAPQVEDYKRATYDQRGLSGDRMQFYMMVDQIMPKVALNIVLDVRAKAHR